MRCQIYKISSPIRSVKKERN